MGNSLMRVVDLEQGTQEWLNFRKFKIGASLAPSIMGVGFKTPLQLFEDIMEDRQTPQNDAMRRGVEMEPQARAWLNHKHQINLQPLVVLHPEFDWHYSSLDGLGEKEDGEIVVTEIKCPGKWDHESAMDGVVPEKYIPQCLHILEDLPFVDKVLYLSYTPESQKELWVYRDREKMSAQFKEETVFYRRLLHCNPPEPTDRDWIETRDGEMLDKAKRYAFLKEQIDSAQALADEIKKEMVERAGAIRRLKVGDLRLQRVERAGAVDYTKIPELQGVNLDAYRKEKIVSWRIS